MTREVPAPREAESPFRIDELFFSTTDRKGIITFGNDVFVRVSRYQFADLLGKPHNIIRHPDMPAVVFWLLWDRLLKGEEVVAYVKNRAKDGSYYWVCAFVAPIEGGFLSIRLKPSSPLFPTVQQLYTQLRNAEQAVELKGGTRKDAIAVSRPMLEEAIRTLGFADYGQLMNAVLPTEAAARRQAKTPTTAASNARNLGATLEKLTKDCNALKQTVGGLLSSVDSFLQLERRLRSEALNVSRLGEKLSLLSLNAQVRTATLQDNGAALQVIAEQMSRSTRGVSDSARQAALIISQATQTLKNAAFHITTGELSLEMMSSFLSELAGNNEARGIEGMRRNIAQLAQVVRHSLQAAGKLANESAACTNNLTRQLMGLAKELRTLEILHVTGRVEAVRTGREAMINSVFDQMQALTLESRQTLSGLAEEATQASIAAPPPEVIDNHLVALSAG